MADNIEALQSPVLLFVGGNTQRFEEIDRFLTDICYQVIHTATSDAAQKQAMFSPPDLILVDANIALKENCSLCSDLKSHIKTRNIPVMMYSEEYHEQFARRAFDMGLVDYLTGPTLNWTMLRNRVQQILKQQHTENELRFLSTVFESTNEGIIITDVNSNIIRVNNGFCRVTGYSEQEVLGKNPRFLQSGRQNRDFYLALWESINDSGQWEGEVWNRRKSGKMYAEWLNISAIYDIDKQPINYVGIFSDITALSSRYEHIAHLAYHDYLTGLPNRMLFEERLSQAILGAERTGGKLGILYIDVDHFKPVNDQYGHETGDQLLKGIVTRLSSCIRQSDTLARVGGDEFITLLPHIEGQDAGVQVAEKMLTEIVRPFSINNHEIKVCCSIGISIYPDNGEESGILVSRADEAMYRIKNSKEEGYALWFDDTVAGDN